MKKFFSDKIEKIKKSLNKFLLNIKSKISLKKKEDMIILPLVGDLIEWENGKRSIVLYSELSEDYVLDLRYTDNELSHSVTNRGRLNHIVKTKKASSWPIDGTKLYRNGYIIYPQKQWKVNFLVWLSSKLFK